MRYLNVGPIISASNYIQKFEGLKLENFTKNANIKKNIWYKQT